MVLIFSHSIWLTLGISARYVLCMIGSLCLLFTLRWVGHDLYHAAHLYHLCHVCIILVSLIYHFFLSYLHRVFFCNLTHFYHACIADITLVSCCITIKHISHLYFFGITHVSSTCHIITIVSFVYQSITHISLCFMLPLWDHTYITFVSCYYIYHSCIALISHGHPFVLVSFTHRTCITLVSQVYRICIMPISLMYHPW